MNETLLTWSLGGAVLVVTIALYLASFRARERKAEQARLQGQLYSSGPTAQHPRIDVSQCIGCQGCTLVCPEGDVLAMVGGKAAIINGHRCIGHGMCADACPVGAIEMVIANPAVRADLPHLSEEFETNVPNLFIAGELGGLALIRNAVNQGRDCIDIVTRRRAASPHTRLPDVYDVIIVGAGPAGISASLRAVENRLHYLTLERDTIGGTVAKYPRQKLVMTSPVEFPLYGRFRKTELSKEALIEFWSKIAGRAGMCVQTGATVDHIRPEPATGTFLVSTTCGAGPVNYRAHAVVLALGRAGTPRKLNIPGDDLPKVMYRLIEAGHYINKRILVVGGGDSAVEAAMGLARQTGNQVTLCHRGAAFARIKERNAQRVAEASRSGSLRLLFNTNPMEFRPDTVLLDVAGSPLELPNDYVWIFAGGTPPNDFLAKIGVRFGPLDITREVSAEAHREADFRRSTPENAPTR